MSHDISEQLEVFSRYVRENGLRMTRQREIVVETFLRSEGHLSADELYDLVRSQGNRVGYATVTRTLKALTQCGLARKTDLADGRARFEHLFKHPHHHHIVCNECKRTIEFLSPELEGLQEKIVSEYNFKPSRSTFQIFGTCQECRQQERSRRKTWEPDVVFARDALRIAMETESRGIKFYSEASKLVTSKTTRKAFRDMLEDERSHFSRLKKRWDRLVKEHPGVLDAPVFLHFDFDALKKIFPSRDQITRRLKTEITEEEALQLAMQMEQDAQRFFSSYADKFNDTRGRDIFLKFAEEEQEHIDTIEAAHKGLLGLKSEELPQ
jgi:Fur family ferric uptake transcriptional regulator